MIYQICYASQTTSSDQLILNDLRDILGEARDFNVRHHIHGVLYYADQYFFQCLEGNEDDVKQICEKIISDQRHKNVKIFEARYLQHSHFNQWSMKYVSRKNEIQTYFKQKQINGFLPHALTDQDISDFLNLLYKMDQTAI